MGKHRKAAKHTGFSTFVLFHIRRCLPWDSACSAGATGDTGLIPQSRRSPGEGNGNPLQYFCLGNPKDRGAWWVIVHGVTKSWTQLKCLSVHTHTLDISQKGSKSEVSLHSLKICIGKEDRWHLWVNGRILVVEMPEFTSLPLS